MHLRERRLLLLSLSLALALLPIILGLMKLHDTRTLKWAERTTKERMHEIQLGMERFATDSEEGVYPDNILVLVKTGYLKQPPTNPFTEMHLFFGPDLGPPRPMQEVHLPAVFPGDFLYLKIRNSVGTGDIAGYTLTCFGWSAYGRSIPADKIPPSYYKDKMTYEESTALEQALFGQGD